MAEDNHNSTSSARCYKHQAEDGPSLLQNGNLTIQAHHVGWIIASFFTIVATAVSFWLVSKHLKWYTNKREQRYIVRILFMVPIYAIISLASYFFWDHATPLILLRDCYESTVLTSFFYLLLIYISPDPEEQRAIFRKVGLSREADNIAIQNREPVKKWMFPLGFVKSKPADGLYFLQAMKWGVLQYCVLRPATTLAAIVLDYIGLYCETSWSPGWGHIYLVLIVSLSVTIAMYCLFQLYMVSKEYLAPQRPLLKLFAIKAVVFLTFWQATFLGVLAMFGVVKDALKTRYMTADDINIGIGALLETFEMMLFAFLHVKAFTYKVYKPVRHDLPPLQTNRLRALGHAMDFRETFRELWAGCVYMWAKMRGREPKVDVGAKRQGYYEGAFGRARPGPSTSTPLVTEKDAQEDARDVTFPSLRTDADRRMDVGGQREWLGAGNHYGYGIYREKSDGLEAQIEMELARRGYGHNRTEIAGKRGNIRPPTEDGTGHPRQRSWWRSLYSRVSQSTDHDYEQESRLSPSPSRQVRESQRRSSRRSLRYGSRDREVERNLVADHRHEIDDPPPPSLIRKYRASSQQRQQPQYEDIYQRRSPPVDVLSPLSVYNEHRMSQMERQQRRHTPPPAQMPSPLAGSRPLSPPVLSSSPPPTSLLLAPAAQHPNLSNDTLLGRVWLGKEEWFSRMARLLPQAEWSWSLPIIHIEKAILVTPLPPRPGPRLIYPLHHNQVLPEGYGGLQRKSIPLHNEPHACIPIDNHFPRQFKFRNLVTWLTDPHRVVDGLLL
ncbi:hypothetical protein V5O48_005607 [Marasmius crinis-equi]|uniref:DUF300-domain-containing protein n=1 Tax=Marasmius crinis-equi TaxID=585013 RepID=A0ABR3FMD2_9AGAR